MITDPITPAEVAANLLNDSGKIEGLVVAWHTTNGNVVHFTAGSVIVQAGLMQYLETIVSDLMAELEEADNEE